ncbi:glutathione S-transferase family protein [Henriciella sp.]|uniref:glutathione S-transferase family protein n=1 Tax=Henriciella sp. TaxID=1968823 RepID=UPI002638D801|nr:glutathione S-transferase family protein [Henriciella sp.]
MPLDQHADIEISAFNWVPDFAQGFVRDLRPRWAMEEAGIAYRTTLLHAAEPRSETYIAAQPFGQVPVMTDGDLSIFESGAILLHLAEKSDILMPKDPAGRAATHAWLFAALNSIEPFMFELFFVHIVHADQEWAKLRKPSLEAFVHERLKPVSAALGDKEYFTGRFTIADIAMTTVLREIDRYLGLSGYPNLEAYLKRCMGRPAFQRALEAQMADFTGKAPEGFPA